jgi:CheY-like chemotaxis protein
MPARFARPDQNAIGSPVIQPKLAPTDLEALVRRVCDSYRPVAAAKGLTLDLIVEPGAGGWVFCDRILLTQVLTQLVDNAVKFTATGGVGVTLACQDGQAGFAVRDTGAGVDPAKKGWAPPWRRRSADASPAPRQGLDVCSEYVRAMGGEIDCAQAPDGGSVFAFVLDLPAATPGVTMQAPPRAQARRRKPANGQALRVLIVDDNDINREILGLILQSVGAEHVMAADGQQAVERFRAEVFDAVLMDIAMPVMDGFEATRQIRAFEAEQGRPRTPVIIVSANCLQEHVDAGVAAGADGHLAKPVSAAALIGALAPHTEAIAA